MSRSGHRDLAPGPTDAVGLLAVQADNDDSSSRQGLGRQPVASVGPSQSAKGKSSTSTRALATTTQTAKGAPTEPSSLARPPGVTVTPALQPLAVLATAAPTRSSISDGPRQDVQVERYSGSESGSEMAGHGVQVGAKRKMKNGNHSQAASTRALAATTQTGRADPSQPPSLARPGPALQPVLAAAAPGGPSQSKQDVGRDSGSESGSVREVAGAKRTLKNGKRSTSTSAKAPGVPGPVPVASFQPDFIVSTASRTIEVLKPFSRLENAQRSLNNAQHSAKAMVDLLSAHYDCEGPDADSNRDRFQLVPIEPSHIEKLTECISDLNANLKAFSDLNVDETTIEFVDSSKYFQVLTRWLEKLDTTRLKLPTYLPVDKTLVVSSAQEAINVAIDEDSLKALWTNTVHLVLYMRALF